MNDLYLKMKESNFDPAASQKAFNTSFKEANDSMIQRTTASYTEAAKEAIKKNKGWGTKNKKDDAAHKLGKKDQKKATPVDQMETAARGKGTNRESLDTGMTAGAEGGAQAVTFGTPAKAPTPEAPKKKYKFE